MQIDLITTPDALAALEREWNHLLIPSPMQSHTWLSTWWECYGTAGRELLVVVGRSNGQVVGIAPWYVETVRGKRIVRWLGDGRVCSDHATLLCRPEDRELLAAAAADWLLTEGRSQWDRLELDSVNGDDAAMGSLVEQATEAGCPAVVCDEPGSCCINLPAIWDDYLMSVSKNHRKRVRRSDKEYFATGRATVDVSTTPDACLAAWDTLVDLHNARRHALGEQGAFEDEQFARFHRLVIPRLAARGLVGLRVLQVDGESLAVEYLLQQGTTWFAYQSGMSPAGEAISAGSLSTLALVRDAIAAGCTQLDLLRGTEPYKLSWGAIHCPAQTLTLRPPTATAHLATLRDSAWQTARRVKRRLTATS